MSIDHALRLRGRRPAGRVGCRGGDNDRLARAPGLARTMTRVTGGVLLARGVGGIPLSLIHGLDTPFGRLSAVLYSPLRVALSRGAVLAGRSAR